MEQAQLRTESEHKAIQDFEWQGQRWQLLIFYWKNQKKYRCPHCEYDHYNPATVLKHLALEHVHTVYRLGQQFDLRVFFRGGARIYKCPDCDFEAERSAAVAEHCGTTHSKLGPSGSESVLEPIVEGAGNASNADASNRKHKSLSPKESDVLRIVGEQKFKTSTDTEIIKASRLRLREECGLKGKDALKSCLYRIRHRRGFPLSSEIKNRRSSPA
jgi:hypothetical protein